MTPLKREGGGGMVGSDSAEGPFFTQTTRQEWREAIAAAGKGPPHSPLLFPPPLGSSRSSAAPKSVAGSRLSPRTRGKGPSLQCEGEVRGQDPLTSLVGGGVMLPPPMPTPHPFSYESGKRGWCLLDTRPP